MRFRFIRVDFILIVLCVIFLKSKNSTMKIFRAIIASVGLSTCHFHNSLPLQSNSISKVVSNLKEKTLFIFSENKNTNYREYNVQYIEIPFKNDILTPPRYFLQKTKRTWTRPPRSIEATRTPKHPQSKHRRR